jgi:hypothetical protein
MSRVRLRHAGAVILIASLPVLVAAALARGLLGGSLLHAVPYVSDEVAYWTQISTFQAAGFDGGYTTINEHPARAPFSHFGPHGPAFSMVYGLPARVTGWGYATGPLFGAVAFILGAAAWIAIARPRLWPTALLLATFWPVVLAAPNTMQESLHFAIACVMAALIGSALAERPTPRTHLWLAWALLAAAALVRPIWALPAIGFGWQLARKRGSRAGAWGLVAGAIACGVLYVAFAYLAAPYPTAVSGLAIITGGPLEVVTALRRAAASVGPWLSGDAEPLDRFYRIEIAVVALLASMTAARAREAGTRRVATAMALTLWALIGASLALRNTGDWQVYRSATPILLMVVLAGVAARMRWTWAVVAAHVLVTPLGVATFREFHEPRWNRSDPVAAIDRFAQSIRGHIRYDPSLSGWGNTVLISLDRYDYPLMGLPPGVAASAAFYWNEVPAPVRSRYLLLTGPEIPAMSGRLRLRKLANTPLGELFENEDWRTNQR